MDVVIISQYLRNIEDFENNNSRFVYLANCLKQNIENDVEIITSDFSHTEKKHFTSFGKIDGVKITVMHEVGYRKNVCLKRFKSHKGLAKNIYGYLTKRKKPDACYCAVPSLEVAGCVADYCKKNNVKFVVDIQDLWPEAFKMVFNVPVLSDMIFKPFDIIANKIYKSADEVVAVSHTYAERAMRVNKKCEKSTIIYLGTEKDTFDEYALKEKSEFEHLINSDKIKIAYCGTLGHSYDISCVLQAISGFGESLKEKIHFIVMGNGPKMDAFVKEAENLPVTFTGRLSYPDMVWILSRCDIAVNPIIKGSAGSVINKHMDYAMSRLPVINTQECLEYRNLIEKYDMGYNCKNGDVDDLREKLVSLLENEEERKQKGKNARRCAEEHFDRKKSYKKIVDVITDLGDKI